MEFKKLIELISEKVVRKKVVRDGTKKILKKSDRDGFKIVDGKEVKMASQERLKKSKAQKKAAIKRKATKSTASIKRKKSNKKRTW